MDDNTLKVQLTIGDIVEANVQHINTAFVEMSIDGVVALLPASEYSWHRPINMKNSGLKEGDKVKAVVIAINDGMAMLSIKRLDADPWIDVDNFYQVGTQLKASVKAVFKFGAFVILPNGIQGLIPKKLLTNYSKSHPDSSISEGQSVDAKIISIEKNERKITLSIIEPQQQ